MIAKAYAARAGARVDGCTFDPFGVTGNVYVHELPESPDVAVMVKQYGGQPVDSRAGVDAPLVQFLVRGERDQPTSGYDLARAIYSEFHMLDGVELGGAPGDGLLWLIGSTAQQSEPVPLGPDDLGRPLWSLNFAARVRALTTHRPT